MMRKIYLAASIGVLAACTTDPGYFPAEITYDCQAGQYFTLTYPTAESAIIQYLNDTRNLERRRSSSGAQYRDFEGNTYLYTKGDEAMLEWDDIRLEGCVARE
ncbi:MliC family protein [Photobacterium sp. SDRW27]|uniref:MliC family protein n=1 Tax=Photobacterium obscurum TaxID=2829490 RepID=UPI00224473CD|nr:MliC family protein [Photobacterium obscurum]MCW8330137.1 MliC family protein [Photobacterium obscurum]